MSILRAIEKRMGMIVRELCPLCNYSICHSEEQRGFRDGLDRGQEDLRGRRAPNPNNSEHFRNSNAAYRDGFRCGYEQGYRQYGGFRRW